MHLASTYRRKSHYIGSCPIAAWHVTGSPHQLVLTYLGCGHVSSMRCGLWRLYRGWRLGRWGRAAEAARTASSSVKRAVRTQWHVPYLPSITTQREIAHVNNPLI